MQSRQLRLCHPAAADSQWLRAALDRASHRFGSRISQQPDGSLTLLPPAGDRPR